MEKSSVENQPHSIVREPHRIERKVILALMEVYHWLYIILVRTPGELAPLRPPMPSGKTLTKLAERIGAWETLNFFAQGESALVVYGRVDGAFLGSLPPIDRILRGVRWKRYPERSKERDDFLEAALGGVDIVEAFYNKIRECASGKQHCMTTFDEIIFELAKEFPVLAGRIG